MKLLKNNPHKTLTSLVALNIIFDIIAIVVWTAVPSSEGNLHYVGTFGAATEAAIAAGLFTVALFGLTKKQPWALTLTIAATIIQRVFATIVFFPSPGIIATLIWSLLIIYLAYKTIKTANLENQKI